MELRNPWLLLLIVPLALTAWYIYRRRDAAVKFSSLRMFADIPYRGLRAYLHWMPGAALFVSTGLLVAALAGPRRGIELIRNTTEGVDIMLCVDVSGSMEVPDMDPQKSRLELVKKVVEQFIDKRRDDQIGLVVFARRAYRLVPMTSDHELLKDFLNDVYIGMVDESRTAVGDALARAVDVVKSGKARSKVVVLLTDGANNAGSISPETAAETAKAFSVRCYTVGAGTDQTVFRRGFETIHIDPVDEVLLGKIADNTGGKYFRAKDEKGLENAYAEIDRLEKTEVKGYAYRRYHEYHPYVLGAALAAAMMYLLLGELWLRRVA
jgi:Ca-activated chloride channel family protein